MKKLLIAAAIVTAFTGATAQAASTDSSGTITFNGELTATTCKVNVNGSGNSDGNVTLPTLETSTMPAQATTAGATHFLMELTECKLANDMKEVSAFFEYGSTVNSNGRLTNQSTDTTKSNVTLELLDANSTTLNAITVGDDNQKANATYKEVVLDTDGVGKATLDYVVRYYAETAAATAGKVSSSVVYALQYK
ncbi:fimbrial protein [Erwinia sp. 198]|uniref:fimbrial protein n=1 Tax=Erwinia sp. 198 TaxID=2022746 RepID=UPI000F674678|nr:fimbrial protein [Erwinia sp. 198]RRZ96985.1 type 1 fimbrial protein [Erwinia sp. 198]